MTIYNLGTSSISFLYPKETKTSRIYTIKDFLLFRDKPELCSDMFNTDDI